MPRRGRWKPPFWGMPQAKPSFLSPRGRVRSPPAVMPTPSALPQVYSFRLTDRTRSALSVTCRARDGKRPLFLRGRGIAFLFVIPALPPALPLALLSSYSFYPISKRCSSACLSLLALLGVILDASWGVLGASWVVLRPSWNSLERSWAVSGPLGLS